MISQSVRFQTLIFVAVCLVQLDIVAARNGGRAFPIEAENFAIDNFKTYNPNLEWDWTNFLVDLSGHYAGCRAMYSSPGVIKVDRNTPSGESIIGVVDYVEGRGTDIDSVNGYIQTIVKEWQRTHNYYYQIMTARQVGCSVRPGCHGFAVVACLFSPGYGYEAPKTVATTTPKPTTKPTTTTEAPELNPPEQIQIWGSQRAQAFTHHQYNDAEGIFGRRWDHSHYLENLSGYETDCSMIGTSDWPFNYMKQAQRPGVRIIGQYGYARNRGSTSVAVREIIAKFKPVYNSREMGCSLIPHCVNRYDYRQMWVVVSCMFEENTNNYG